MATDEEKLELIKKAHKRIHELYVQVYDAAKEIAAELKAADLPDWEVMGVEEQLKNTSEHFGQAQNWLKHAAEKEGLGGVVPPN